MADYLFDIDTLSEQAFLSSINENGFAVVQGVFDRELMEKTKRELRTAIAKEADFHGSVEYKDYAMLLACPIYGGAFLDVLENRKLMAPFDWMLGDTSIIYVYTSSSMPPDSTNYSARIHVDRPHFIPGYTEAMGCLILLDHFTEANGATWVLPGSHQQQEKPDEDFFYQNALRIVAPEGSVFYFHLRLWHAGGVNHTTDWRHSLGIGMIRPYLKQRIDLPRALAHTDLSKVSDHALQKLGFFAQPPASLEQYYASPAERMYRQRSEWETK